MRRNAGALNGTGVAAINRRAEPKSHTINLVKGGSGPPLLMLHGDMRTSRSWDAVARDLSSRFRVIAMDARGHGGSDWTPRGYAFRERAEDLTAFCEHLGLSGLIGVGHSTGGVVMSLLAQARPGIFSRLVLLEPMVVVDEAFHRMVSARAGQPRRTWATRADLREHLEQHPVARRWRSDVIEAVVAHEGVELPDGSIDMKWSPHSFNWAERDGDYHDLKPFLRDSGVPILFITSEARRGNFEYLIAIATEASDFELLVINGTDHNMYMERPDAVSRAIGDFVDGKRLPTAL